MRESFNAKVAKESQRTQRMTVQRHSRGSGNPEITAISAALDPRIRGGDEL
jgi:hypothetical protein